MPSGGCSVLFNIISHYFQSVKKRLSGLILFVVLIIYTIVGAKVFQILENVHEQENFRELKSELHEKKSKLLSTLLNLTADKQLESMLIAQLEDFEDTMEKAHKHGVEIENQPQEWSYVRAVFFVSTVLTTIGYGNMAPRTLEGRMFCILFSVIGIPIAVAVIADMGKPFASILSKIFKAIKKSLSIKSSHAAAPESLSIGGKMLIIVSSLTFLALYISIGGIIFSSWEDWTFFEAFYFSFITMTTIGFGDFVPTHTDYMLPCILYILVGLGLTSTIVELVRRQYLQSWEKMKQLRLRLQDLSGSLSDTLRRMGDKSTGQIDPNFVQEIRELKSLLSFAKRKFDEDSRDFDFSLYDSECLENSRNDQHNCPLKERVYLFKTMYENEPPSSISWLKGVRPFGRLLHLWKGIPYI